MKTLALASVLALSLCAAALAADASHATHAAHAADTSAGKALYTAKCQSCHGADGAKAMMSKPVKGMKAEAVVKAMEGYKAKTYGGTKKATMENLSAALSAGDIKALAAYIATL